MSFHCKRQCESGKRFCVVEMEGVAAGSSTGGGASEAQNMELDHVNIESGRKTENIVTDTDHNSTVPPIGQTSSKFGRKLQMGLRRRETVSGFKSRRWSFTSRRPTSFRGKQQLQRRNSEPKVHVEEQPSPMDCKRLHMRRGALSNPELMAMPQNIREKVQKDVEVRRKSLKRKISNFIAVHLDLDKEIDLF